MTAPPGRRGAASDSFVGIGVGSDAAACPFVEGVDGGDVLGGQREVKDADVVLHPSRVRRLGDRDVTVVHMPAQDDLCGGFAVPGGDPADRLVAQRLTVVTQGAMGLHRDAMLCGGRDRCGVGEVRVQLELVDRRYLTRLGDDAVQMGRLKVRHSRAAQSPFGDELGDRFPG
jgi:hypothetical protein